MASAAKGAKVSSHDHYLELIKILPLRHLQSGHELAEASKMIDSLIVRGDLAKGEQEYLDVLTDLVERYEARAYPIEPVADAVMLRHLIESFGKSLNSGSQKMLVFRCQRYRRS